MNKKTNLKTNPAAPLARWRAGFTQHHFSSNSTPPPIDVLGNKLVSEKKLRFNQSGAGFTLIEVIITIAVFSILLLAVINISQQIHNLAANSRYKTTAATVAQEQIELIRNLPFDQIGSDVTFPTGPLLSTQTITRNGGKFTVSVVINYVDDPSDGVLPADTVPADYKKVEVRVCWNTSSCNNPVRLTTLVVPKTLEYADNAGALFITVVDANAQPVSGATVHVTNAIPAVDVINETDVNGQLQLLNLPAAENSYRITASKNGYSTDQTHAVSVSNPNPTNADPSVRANDKIDVLLAIDRVSSLAIHALDQATCGGLGSVSVRIIGQDRKIGKEPDVPAYDHTFVTDASGQFIIANLPYDTYSFSISSAGDDIAGITPPDNIKINPGSSVTGSIVLAEHQTHTARIIVRDAATHGPIANARVAINNGGAYSAELITDQGIIQQFDWMGGPGQANLSDLTKYATDTSAINTSAPNEISLAAVSAATDLSEDFHTTANRDDGNTTADWQTGSGTIQLPPNTLILGEYLATAQAQSKKLNPVEGQITSVTVNATEALNGQLITYEVAADGTTFETVSLGQAHTFGVSGSDLRWRVKFDRVDNSAVTPQVTALSLHYNQLTRPVVDGTLTSSTFDSGGPTNYTTLSWEPTGQPPSAGSEAVRFQVATAGSTIDNGGPAVDTASNPSTAPLLTKNIGDASNTAWLAQSFVASANDTIESIDLKIAQHGTPTASITAYIYSDFGDAPADNLSGSGQDIANVPSDGSSTWQDTWLTQTFSPHTALTVGTKYWLVIGASGSNSSKYWTVVRSNDDDVYATGTAMVGAALNNLAHICVPVAPNTGCDMAFQIRRSGMTETPTTPTNFVGPDGTTNSYYTASGSTVHSSLSGFRYLRYRLLLHTDDPAVSPTVSRVSIIKNNACTPPGQVFFSPLPDAGIYSADVTADGFQPVNASVDVSGNTSQYIELTANP